MPASPMLRPSSVSATNFESGNPAAFARSTGMTAGSGSDAVAGGPARHIPVLARLAIDWLAVKPGGLYVDATFGGGGYARAIMQTVGARVIGIDRDHTAVAQGAPLVEQAQGQLQLVEDRFSNL